MGFFNFLKSQLLKSIDWTDPSPNTMVYKYPMEGRDIMIGSKLTVRESQVAIFMVKGKIADVFQPGIHTLVVNNIPILSSLLSLGRDKKAFTADVFYVNTKQFTNQKWGTTNPITMRDKDFGSIRIRGYGSFAFKVSDAAVFLKEVFGTNSTYTSESVANYLKSILVSGISDTIAESKISALDLASNLLEFSKVVKEQVNEQFTNLGLTLSNLVIENISFPEQVEKAIDTQSSMGVLKNSMDTYTKFKAAEAIGDAAKNPGMAGMGAQLGTGMALGEIVKETIKSSTSAKEEKPAEAAAPAGKKFCPECGAANTPKAKFCAECGKKLAAENVCPECGEKLAPNAKFCGNCGKKLK